MTITDLGHAAFRVQDITRALEFYALLGIHEAFRFHHEDASLMLIYLHVAGDRFIELFPGGEPTGPDQQTRFMHLCLLTDDLHGMVEALRGRGIAIDKEPTLGLDHNWQAWIVDPDGNPIELMQLAPGSPQRRAATEQLDGSERFQRP